MPDTTAAYIEIYAPIGLVVDFEKSSFFKKLAASPAWKELESTNEGFRNYKDTLARISALRKAVGPVGFAFIPSFSDDDGLFFVRIQKDYVGAVKTGLERFLDSQEVKYGKSERAGRIRYDLESPPGASLLLMDSGIVGADTPILERYIEWLDRKDKASLRNLGGFNKINNSSGGSNSIARLYFDSGAATVNQSALKNVPDFTGWSRIDLQLNSNGLLIKTSTALAEESVVAKGLLEKFQTPIANRSLKYLPKESSAFITVNLAGVAQVAKEFVRLSEMNVKDREMAEKLLDALQGEGLFALVPDVQGQFGWFDGFVVGLQQRTPSAFIKALDEILPEIKGLRQAERYHDHEITCYPGIFGIAPCFIEVDDFLFLSLNKERIHRILDVYGSKMGGFEEAIKSEGNLRRLLGGPNLGTSYVDLKALVKAIISQNDLIEVTRQEVRFFKEKLLRISKPVYLAGTINLRGDVFEGQALLSVDFSEVEDLVLQLFYLALKEYNLLEKGSLDTIVPSMGNRHISRSQVGLTTYNSDPPTSGPHLQSIAPWGIHATPITKELQVHNLEDGGVVVQYNCQRASQKCRELVDKLARIVRRYNHALLAPYPGMSHRITLTAWSRIDKFNEFDENRIGNFIEAYINLDHHPARAARSP